MALGVRGPPSDAGRMRSERLVPFVAWAVLGILVISSALAVLASRASGALAFGVALGGVVAALLLAWAVQPGRSAAGEEPAERLDERHPKAA